MDTGGFVFEIEAEYFYSDIAKGVDAIFANNRYSKDNHMPLPKEKDKKVMGMVKSTLGGRTIAEFLTNCFQLKCLCIGSLISLTTQPWARKKKNVSSRETKRESE